MTCLARTLDSPPIPHVDPYVAPAVKYPFFSFSIIIIYRVPDQEHANDFRQKKNNNGQYTLVNKSPKRACGARVASCGCMTVFCSAAMYHASRLRDLTLTPRQDRTGTTDVRPPLFSPLRIHWPPSPIDVQKLHLHPWERSFQATRFNEPNRPHMRVTSPGHDVTNYISDRKDTYLVHTYVSTDLISDGRFTRVQG